MRSAEAEWGSKRPTAFGRAIIGLSRSTPLGRGRARRWLLKGLRRVHADAVDTRLWGSRVRLHPWSNASERKALMRPDRLDAREHALLATIMTERASVFVDIGANAGLYSLHAALCSAPGGRILAVEPNADLLDRFVFNIALARHDGLIADDVHVETLESALSDYDGAGVLVEAATEGTRHLVQAGAGEPVAVRRLHAVLGERGIDRIDILKIDVEGAEDRILPPFLAAASEESWPRVIVIEHLSREAWRTDCIADCVARGYSVAGRTRNNTILRR